MVFFGWFFCSGHEVPRPQIGHGCIVTGSDVLDYITEMVALALQLAGEFAPQPVVRHVFLRLVRIGFRRV